MKQFAYILLSISLIISCSKTNVNPSILNGKLKSIEVVNDSTGVVYHHYMFLYDSISGEFRIMIRDNTDSVSISKISTSIIKMNFSYPGPGANFEAFAYLNSNGLVESINASYPFDDPTTRFYSFRLNGTNIDSIIEPDIIYPAGWGAYRKSFYNFDIVYNGNNYTNSKVFYKRIYLNGLTPPDSGITSFIFSYTPYLNNGMVPFQTPYGFEFESEWFLDQIDPVFLLNIAGFRAFKPNKNLIDKVELSSGGQKRFNYKIDNNNKVIELQNNTDVFTYKMTYF
jgi:hypothetical protein